MSARSLGFNVALAICHRRPLEDLMKRGKDVPPTAR